MRTGSHHNKIDVEGLIAFVFMCIVMVIGSGIWAYTHFSYNAAETSKENYKNTETFAERFPKVKHMLQDFMTDDILTNSEYDRVEDEYSTGLKEEEQEESRASLLKVIYKKETKDGVAD